MMHFCTQTDAIFALKHSYIIRLKQSPKTNIKTNLFICPSITCVDVSNKCTKPNEKCKDTDGGPICKCKYGYIRKDGYCVGKLIRATYK